MFRDLGEELRNCVMCEIKRDFSIAGIGHKFVRKGNVAALQHRRAARQTGRGVALPAAPPGGMRPVEADGLN